MQANPKLLPFYRQALEAAESCKNHLDQLGGISWRWNIHANLNKEPSWDSWTCNPDFTDTPETAARRREWRRQHAAQGAEFRRQRETVRARVEPLRDLLRDSADMVEVDVTPLLQLIFSFHLSDRPEKDFSPEAEQALIRLQTRLRNVIRAAEAEQAAAAGAFSAVPAKDQPADGNDDPAIASSASVLNSKQAVEPAPNKSEPQSPRTGSDGANDEALELIPAGFAYRGEPHDLSGYPLEMLRVLLASRYRRASANHLRQALGIDDEITDNPEQAVKDAAKLLRAALKKAVTKAGLNCDDPLPSIGKGKDLAYKLEVP